MHEGKNSGHEHHERVVEQDDHSRDSDGNSSDIEKRSHGIERLDSSVPREDDAVTLKTWAVVVVLAASYGISFWPVPFFSTIQSQMAVSFGASAAQGTWFTSVYSIAGTIAFMLCGANSDLFGLGAILGGTSHSTTQTTAAHAILGFGGGNCQIAAFALPELLPNKWRHVGVVIADAGIYFDVIAGPVVSRIALRNNAWRWGYWGILVAQGISFLVLLFFYFPPKHPRGIAWNQALRDLDYVGMVSFTAAAAMILSGIVYVELLPSNDPIVIALLVVGFAALVFFALWETFAKLKEPLAPTRLFVANKGRKLTAPFICGFVVTMFYYANNITWPTMVGVYFTGPTTPLNTIYWLATVQGFGIFTGAMILSFFGRKIGHWKFQMGVPITIMTFFGAMLGYITPQRKAMGIAFAFLSSTGYGYAQYLSIAYIQFGADQTELGIAGGLAGVARYAGGAVAITLFSTILGTVQNGYAAVHVIAAAEGAGATPATARAVLAALPLGAAALEKVQGLTTAIAQAAGAAFVQSYVEGVKKVAFASLGFGGVAIIACFFLEDIGPKMNNQIEVFLENDEQAEKNKYH
ncbi:fungal trichothecene efflux pump-domain-containing protein [Paraphoma chrysanthemicola]|uniref:Fungal trichothecene efflux pump-domain-containing protein n=1 Tax=Paraphoma chrysanthemicola TaxID=798071 RepID=A0A8K0VTL3_9PLEO|nr:fungal trichothecene efflux pump-domain-containing protein [Paraphoma chrysanthemicola]